MKKEIEAKKQINDSLINILTNIFSYLVIIFQYFFYHIYLLIRFIYNYYFAIKKENVPQDIQNFLDKNFSFPFTLTINSDGDIETNNCFLNSIPSHKLKYQLENNLSDEKRIIKKNYELFNNLENGNKISLNGSNQNFENTINNLLNESKNKTSNCIFIKRKLFSLSIKEEDIILSKKLNHDIEIISSLEKDKDKIKELSQIFEKTGYYIPLKIYFGGIFIRDIEKMNKHDKEELENNIKLLSKSSIPLNTKYDSGSLIKKEKFIFSKLNKTIGGDVNTEKFQDWVSTVCINNSNIIEYSNYTEIPQILGDKLKKKLNGPLEEIKKMFKRREECIKIINSLKNEKFELKGEGDLIKGQTLNTEFLQLDEPEKITIKKDWKYFRGRTGKIEQEFKSIIIGLKIKWGRTGKYNFEFNPLLSKKLKCEFNSQSSDILDVEIEIYSMKNVNI